MPLGDLTPQLRTRLLRMERFVGLFVAASAALILAGFVYYLYHTAERRGWFVPVAPYFTLVESATGLQVGDPILLMGFSVGEITQIEAMPPDSRFPYNVFVAFEVKKPYYGYIWTDSQVRIGGGALLGGRLLELTKGIEGQPTVYEDEGRPAEMLVEGQRVALKDEPKGVFLKAAEEQLLTKRAEQLLEQLEARIPAILERVDTLLASATTMVGDASVLAKDARPVVAHIRTITGQLRDPDGSLGRWLLTPELREGLDTTLTTLNADLETLNETLVNLAAMTGSLRQQVESNDHLIDEISSLITETDDLVQGLKRHWLLQGAFEESPGSAEPVPEAVEAPLLAPPGGGAP